MSATITWIIEWMNAYPEHEGKANVVVSVGWRCNGEQADGNRAHYGTVYGSASFAFNSEDTFTPYTDLTQEQVLDWVWATGVDKSSVEADVASQIAIKSAPTVVSPPLPWVIEEVL